MSLSTPPREETPQAAVEAAGAGIRNRLQQFLAFASLIAIFLFFSIGTGMTLCAVMSGVLIVNSGVPIVIGVIGTVVFGGLIGLVNGFNVSVLGIPPFTVTLAMMLHGDLDRSSVRSELPQCRPAARGRRDRRRRDPEPDDPWPVHVLDRLQRGGHRAVGHPAVVIGGTSLSGGKGSIVGTLIGALIISVLRSRRDQPPDPRRPRGR